MAHLKFDIKKTIRIYRDWQALSGGPDNNILNKLDEGFQESVRHFYTCGDVNYIRYFVDALEGADRKKLVEYLVERLPFSFKGKNRDNFQVSKNWKEAQDKTIIKALNPFNTIKFKQADSDIAGNIRLEKTYANLDELHAFILDCLVLYRNEFSNEQLNDLHTVISRISKKIT